MYRVVATDPLCILTLAVNVVWLTVMMPFVRQGPCS